jgi:hypothetical protein
MGNGGPEFGRIIPSKTPTDTALDMIHDKDSIAIIKRKDERGYPCLNPLVHWNSGVGEPFTRTDA